MVYLFLVGMCDNKQELQIYRLQKMLIVNYSFWTGERNPSKGKRTKQNMTID